jgi:hypothetical protein
MAGGVVGGLVSARRQPRPGDDRNAMDLRFAQMNREGGDG